MSIFVLPFIKTANYIRILVIVDTSTKYAKIISVIEYQHGGSTCLTIHCVSETRFFERQTVHMTVNLVH